jgi:hypothetical protein
MQPPGTSEMYVFLREELTFYQTFSVIVDLCQLFELEFWFLVPIKLNILLKLKQTISSKDC